MASLLFPPSHISFKMSIKFSRNFNYISDILQITYFWSPRKSITIGQFFCICKNSGCIVLEVLFWTMAITSRTFKIIFGLHSLKNFASICVHPINEIHIGHEVLITVTTKSGVFWVVVACSSNTAPYFGGTYCFHHQGQRVSRASLACFLLLLFFCFFFFSSNPKEVGGNVSHQNVGLAWKCCQTRSGPHASLFFSMLAFCVQVPPVCSHTAAER